MTPHSLNHTNQSRVDARIAYFDPIFGDSGTPRPNIDVLLQNMVTKLITETSANGTVTVTGVEVSDLRQYLLPPHRPSLIIVSSHHQLSPAIQRYLF